MAENNNLQDMIRTSLESIKTMVDANTVVGTPIETPSGTTIIPISKVSVGYASGGSDFGGKNASKNFAGGGGTGLSVQPVCFIAVNAEGNVELLPLGGKGENTSADKIADLIEKAPGLIEKIKAFFRDKKKKKAEKEAEEDALIDEMTEAAATALDGEETEEKAPEDDAE